MLCVGAGCFQPYSLSPRFHNGRAHVVASSQTVFHHRGYCRVKIAGISKGPRRAGTAYIQVLVITTCFVWVQVVFSHTVCHHTAHNGWAQTVTYCHTVFHNTAQVLVITACFVWARVAFSQTVCHHTAHNGWAQEVASSHTVLHHRGYCCSKAVFHYTANVWAQKADTGKADGCN